jgi:hypothetical protein
MAAAGMASETPMDPGLGDLAAGGLAEPAFYSGVDAEAAGRSPCRSFHEFATERRLRLGPPLWQRPIDRPRRG